MSKSIAKQWKSVSLYYHALCLNDLIKREKKKADKAFARKHTCPVCNIMIYDDEADKTLVLGVYHHVYCYENKKLNQIGRQELIDYLDKLYKRSGLAFNKRIFAQIKRYNENPEYKFQFEGMRLTLEYYCEILENDFTDGVFSLIPYYYDEAKAFEKKKRSIKKYVESLGEKAVEVKHKTITIPVPELQNRIRDRLEVFNPDDPDLIGQDGDDCIVNDFEVIEEMKRKPKNGGNL